MPPIYGPQNRWFIGPLIWVYRVPFPKGAISGSKISFERWTTQWFQCWAHVIANVIFKYWLFHTPSGSKCGQGFPCEHTGNFLDGVPICLRRAEQTITSATGDLPRKQKPSPKLTYMFEHTHLIKATQSYKPKKQICILSFGAVTPMRSNPQVTELPLRHHLHMPSGGDDVTWHTERMYKWNNCSCPPPVVAVQSVPTWLCNKTWLCCKRSVGKHLAAGNAASGAWCLLPSGASLPTNDFVQHSAVQPRKVLCLNSQRHKGHEIAPFLK